MKISPPSLLSSYPSLISNTRILKHLIDIALRPKQAELEIPLSITTSHTHKSVEVLGCLSEEFSHLMFDEGKNENAMEEEVLQEEGSAPENDYFTYLLKILEEEEIVE